MAATPIFSRHVVANLQCDVASVVIRIPMYVSRIRLRWFARNERDALLVTAYRIPSFA